MGSSVAPNSIRGLDGWYSRALSSIVKITLRWNLLKTTNLDRTETGNHDNWEQTSHTGSHWIQCFAVRSGVCVAQSDKFIINIWDRDFPV